MRHWEYLTITLVHSFLSESWVIREAGQEVKGANWYKKQGYPSISSFCNLMDEMGWELITASYNNQNYITLFFRHPII